MSVEAIYVSAYPTVWQLQAKPGSPESKPCAERCPGSISAKHQSVLVGNNSAHNTATTTTAAEAAAAEAATTMRHLSSYQAGKSRRSSASNSSSNYSFSSSSAAAVREPCCYPGNDIEQAKSLVQPLIYISRAAHHPLSLSLPLLSLPEASLYSRTSFLKPKRKPKNIY